MICTCGHVEDEHNERNGTCEVDGCDCAGFDHDADADDDDADDAE